MKVYWKIQWQTGNKMFIAVSLVPMDAKEIWDMSTLLVSVCKADVVIMTPMPELVKNWPRNAVCPNQIITTPSKRH